MKKLAVDTDNKLMVENLYHQQFRQGLAPRVYQESQKLNNKQQKLPINMWANELNKHFFKRQIHIVNKYCKSVQDPKNSIMETQTKTALKYDCHQLTRKQM